MNDLKRPFSLDTYLADLAPLINLDCGTRTPAGVARVADIMTEKYEAIGWQVTRHQFAAECGPCLEATNAPGADHYDVMLVGHMDTVFPEGTAAKRPLKIEGNQAFGPGVSDMKSGLLSTWYALKELDPAVLARLKVLVCCNCDEEIGSPYSKEWLVDKAKQSGCVLVAEAARPNGDLISARKGNAKYRITFHGKASHAGSALTEGVSAITELAHWVLAINEQVNLDTGTTMNVGVVQGGTGVNVVPDCLDLQGANLPTLPRRSSICASGAMQRRQRCTSGSPLWPTTPSSSVAGSRWIARASSLRCARVATPRR